MSEPRGRGFAFAAGIAAAAIVIGMLLRFTVAIGTGDQSHLQVLTLLGVLALGAVVWLIIWLVWFMRRSRMRQRVIAAYPTHSQIIDLFPSLSSIPIASDQDAGELLARSRMSQLSMVLTEDQVVFVRLGGSSTSVDQYPLEAIQGCDLTDVRSGVRNLRAIQLKLTTGDASATATLVPRALNGAGLVPARAPQTEQLGVALRQKLEGP